MIIHDLKPQERRAGQDARPQTLWQAWAALAAELLAAPRGRALAIGALGAATAVLGGAAAAVGYGAAPGPALSEEPAAPGEQIAFASADPALFDAEPGALWRNRAQFRDPGGPLVGVVLSGLGRDAELDAMALALPGVFAYGIDGEGPAAPRLAVQARARGGEVFVEASLTASDSDAAAAYASGLLGEFPQAAGVLDSPDALSFIRLDLAQAFTEELARGGHAFIDTRRQAASVAPVAARLSYAPTLERDVLIKADASRAERAEAFRQAELMAERGGQALVVVEASTANIEALRDWIAAGAGADATLAPPSALFARAELVRRDFVRQNLDFSPAGAPRLEALALKGRKVAP